jgi:hypothetical protein
LNDPEKGYKGPKKEGLDFFVEHVMWKQLPKELFEVFGGREMAKIRRQEILISQGKGKVPKDAVKESSAQIASEEMKETDSGDVPNDATAAGGGGEGTAAVVATEQNTSAITDFKRKRSPSFDDVKVEGSVIKSDVEDDKNAIKRAQLELEAALEEAEFQSLLLAQNESKEEDEIAVPDIPLILPSTQILPSLMPPSVPIWGSKKEVIAYRVPAVTWTLLDTK